MITILPLYFGNSCNASQTVSTGDCCAVTIGVKAANMAKKGQRITSTG
jgi:hypothetical protein